MVKVILPLLRLWQLFVHVHPAEISVTSNTSYVHSEEAAQSKFHYLSMLNLACLVCLACLFVKSYHSIPLDIKAPCIQHPKYCRDLKREGWPHYTKPRRTDACWLWFAMALQRNEKPVEPVSQTLEVDSAEEFDAKSALTDQVPIATSPTPNVTEYSDRHGRRYHTFEEDAYWLPNGDTEIKRLGIQHHTWRLTLNGKLYT